MAGPFDMTSEERAQCARLLLIQHTDPDPEEDRILRADVQAYDRAQSTRQGENFTGLMTFADGTRGYHKPINGVKADLAEQVYGHRPIGTILNECAFWRMARFLGDPWASLVPPTVARFHRATAADHTRNLLMKDGWGSVNPEVPGDHLVFPLYSLSLSPAEEDLLDAAALLDAISGNQDRHLGNYRWDAGSGHLWLLDHGFTFPHEQGDFNQSAFVEARIMPGRSRHALSSDEMNAIDRLFNHSSLAGLELILDAEQLDLLRHRLEWMLNRGELFPWGQRRV